MPTILEKVSLQPYNSLALPAVAEFFCAVQTSAELLAALEFARSRDLPVIPLGGGSNIVLAGDITGLVLRIDIKAVSHRVLGELVEVTFAAGENWHDFVLWAVKNNFGGIENLSLIPGNVGAAPIQNIGAYGVELKDIFHSCRGVMLDSLNEFELTKSECEFDYRSSIFKSKFKNKIIITSVQFILTKSRHNFNINYNDLKINLVNTELTIKKISDEVIRIRKSKLPDPKSFGNCGSFFKNPIVNISRYKSLIDKFPKIPCHKINKSNYKISAAWLIDQSGFKNKKDKKVGVYVNQPLVIINHGNASGRDLLNLANNIKETIYSNFEIELEEEVLII